MKAVTISIVVASMLFGDIVPATAGNADQDLNVAIAIGRLIKKASKDPYSFRMDSVFIFPDGSTCYEFHAKNSFGAYVPAKAVFDGSNTWHSEKNGAQFARVWNKVCTRNGGVERAGGLNRLGVWD